MTNILLFLGWGIAVWLVVVLMFSAIKTIIPERSKKLKVNKATIYAGTEDNANYFQEIISTLGLDIDYHIEIVDGEYEILIK